MESSEKESKSPLPTQVPRKGRRISLAHCLAPRIQLRRTLWPESPARLQVFQHHVPLAALEEFARQYHIRTPGVRPRPAERNPSTCRDFARFQKLTAGGRNVIVGERRETQRGVPVVDGVAVRPFPRMILCLCHQLVGVYF